MSALLEVRGLRKSFWWRPPSRPWRRRELVAVDGVDLMVGEGECLAVVGESGSGKTTLGLTMLRLWEPDAGEIFFAGEDLRRLSGARLRRRRTDFQMVFQDSEGALDPRLRVGSQIAEPLRIHRLAEGRDLRLKVVDLLDLVGLDKSMAERYPHQLSGGQRQRVCLARALATNPRMVVLDEPLSALDVSVQALVLEVLKKLRQELGLAMVLITHDLSVVEQIADRVAVFYLGRVVEIGPADEVFRNPSHPYTQALLGSVPWLDV